MPSSKTKSSGKSKKDKNKLIKFIESESEEDKNIHELSFYINDRVKLMKEVLKIIKAKKIKSMAPDCIRNLDMEEINSMLLEELLGISNKRLKYIFNGQNLDEDSSSTDPEDETNKPIDIISLDDISDDDLIIDVDSEKPKKRKKRKIKKERQEKQLQEDNLMSVLELLELQARARAIRSQLTLEANKKAVTEIKNDNNDDDDDDDAVIIQSPKNDEIIITSSDEETERSQPEKQNNGEEASCSKNGDETPKSRKITLNRDCFTSQNTTETTCQETSENNTEKMEKQEKVTENDESHMDHDEIVINVDQDEMAEIIE